MSDFVDRQRRLLLGAALSGAAATLAGQALAQAAARKRTLEAHAWVSAKSNSRYHGSILKEVANGNPKLELGFSALFWKG